METKKQDWKMVKLGEVLKQDKASAVSIDPSKNYEMVGVYSFGRGLFHKESQLGLNTSYKVFYQLKENHVVLSQLFGWEGALALSSKEFEGKFVSNQFPTFLADETKAARDFIGFFLKRKKVWEMLFERGTGMGSRRRMLNPESLLGLEIPLPPLAEQQRIAGHLAALKGKIDAVRRLREEQVREVNRLTFDVLDQFFVEGEEKTIGQICEKPQYGYTASADFQNIGVRFVRITDIQNGQVQWDSVPYCQCEKPDNYLLKENDILFARTGGTIGKSFLVKAVPEDSVFASYLIRLRVKEKVLPEFLYLFFQSKSYWQQITDSKTGTGQPNLNGSKLSEIVLKVPDLQTQRHIVAEVQAFQTKMEQLKAAQAGQLAGLEGLFPGVLERAFRGEW
jgi:restriction endonuclease S subunit